MLCISHMDLDIVNEKEIVKAVNALENGGVIAFPTDTVYGIGVDGESSLAIEKLYALKGRSAGKATQLLIGDISWLSKYCDVTQSRILPFLEQCWPGPLTVILSASECVPPLLLGKGNSVGVRIPNHPIILKILKIFGRGIAASSANPSGALPAKSLKEIKNYFSEGILITLNGAPEPEGISSTVIDATAWPPKMVREGGLSKDKIVSILKLPSL